MKLQVALLTWTTIEAVNYPVGITNCGVSSWIEMAPQRAITMNQGTTEIMLALGLADRMVGTAYLDDEIWRELAQEYAKVPVLSAGYPTPEQIQELNPDFLYASYSSAFATSHVNYTDQWLDQCELVVPRDNGDNRTHCRQELHVEGVQTYLQETFCELVQHRPEKLTLDALLDEIWDIATIFDALEQSQLVIDQMKEHFALALQVTQAAAAEREGGPLRVLWLDSIDTKGAPYVGACCGAVQIILESSGATNVFSHLGIDDRKSWVTVTWDDIVAMDPDLIVVVEASWDSVEEKIYNLCDIAESRELRAVKNRAFLTVPFSASTLGVRIGSLAYNLAEAFSALVQNTPLPSLEFTSTSLLDNANAAVAGSGVKVYEKLPFYVNEEQNINVDLDEFCPGSSTVTIGDPREDPIPISSISGESENLEGWAKGLIVALCLVTAGVVVALLLLVMREKNGKPMFAPATKLTNDVDFA